MSMQRKRLLMGGGFSLIVTSFSQAVGAELLTNGDFSAWTGAAPNRDPDGWAVTGETGTDPEITEVAANEGHGGVGTGAANFFSSASANVPRLTQTVLSVGGIYEIAVNVTTRVGGSIFVLDTSAGISTSYATTGDRRILGRAAATGFRIQGSTGTDVTVDDCSIKLITLNTYRSTIANGSFRQMFTLPVSPVAGQEIHILYRMPSSGSEFLNGWDAYLRRNDGNTAWDIRLDSIAAGTRTNRRAVTGVGDVTGIRVDAIGTTHQLYTFDSNAWTAQGAVVNVSLQDTSVGVNTIASTGFTQNQLEVLAL